MAPHRMYLILFLLNILKQVTPFELHYPDFIIYEDNLRLTRTTISIGIILSLTLLLSVICYQRLPIKLLIVNAAVIFNLMIYYADVKYFTLISTTLVDSHEGPHSYIGYYIVVYIASVSFQCEKSDFQRILPYALLTLPMMLCTAFFNGYILYALTILKWSCFQMFIYGVSTCAVQPDPFSYSIQNNKVFTKLNQLAIGEYVGMMVLSLTIGELYLEEKVVGWVSFWTFVPLELLAALLLGILFGFLISSTLSVTNDDAKSCFLIIISSMIIVMYAAKYIGGSPFVAVFGMVPSLFKYKKHFSHEANEAIVAFFHMSHIIIDVLTYTYYVHLAIYCLVIFESPNTLKMNYCIFGFCCALFSRSIIYLLLSPFIKKLSKSLDTVQIVVNSWASITSNAAFFISFAFFFNKRTHQYGRLMLCQVTFSAMCTNVICPVALEFLRRTKFASHFTEDQAANINVCLHEIRSLRVKYIYMWKMKSIMTDSRWDMIKNLTNIFHNSKTSGTGEIMLWKSVACPDCGREIQVQQPINNVADFTKLSRKLIKNQMKTILIRRHQFSNISSSAAKLSIKMVEKCLTFENHVQDEIFQPFMKLTGIRERLYKWEQRICTNRESLKHIPRKPYRAKFYHFVRTTTFSYIMFFLTVYSITTLMLSVFITSFSSVYFYIVISLSEFTIIPMIVKMYLFINAYSIFSIRRGARHYFKSKWHCIETASLIFALIDFLVVITFYVKNDVTSWRVYKYVRLIKLVEILSALWTSMPQIIHSMEEMLVGRISLGYEVAKAIYDAYSELELSMDFIFDDNVLMASECEKWVRDDKRQLYKIFTYFQYNYPKITRKVKTRQAMDATLTALNMTLDEVRSLGYVDIREYDIIKKKLRSCEKRGIELLKRRKGVSSKNIFQNVPWVNNTSSIVHEYLITVGTVKALQTDEYLCQSGDEMNGVYLILSGMLEAEYNPTTLIVSHLLRYGLLPVFKYSDSLQYFEQVQHTLGVGNSVGELSVAVKRPINTTVRAVKPSTLLYIDRYHIEVVEKYINDPIGGVIAQMWKMSCFNVAIAILKSLPKYEYYTQQDIKMKVEASFVPDLSMYEAFTFLDAIDDLILLHGAVKDFYDDAYYVAPCYIPRTCMKFHMHQTHFSEGDGPPPYPFIETKLMIIPMQDIDNQAVMKLVHQVAVLREGVDSVQYTDSAIKVNLTEAGTIIGGFASMKAVTQGSHLTRFINLKK